MPTREQLRTFYWTATGLESLRPDAPLRPSGLIGPVTLIAESE